MQKINIFTFTNTTLPMVQHHQLSPLWWCHLEIWPLLNSLKEKSLLEKHDKLKTRKCITIVVSSEMHQQLVNQRPLVQRVNELKKRRVDRDSRKPSYWATTYGVMSISNGRIELNVWRDTAVVLFTWSAHLVDLTAIRTVHSSRADETDRIWHLNAGWAVVATPTQVNNECHSCNTHSHKISVSLDQQ